MSNVSLRYVDSLAVPPSEHSAFVSFLQRMMNRRQVGYTRYGATQKRQQYLTRMKKELVAYEQTGNMEQLLNIANYCFLESFAPENKKFHFDNSVESVTRK